MQNQHTRRGFTQTQQAVIKQGCHSRGILSGISRVQSCCNYLSRIISYRKNNTYVGDPRTLRAAKPSGMTPNKIMTHGFTLIELLVVVLIIGILAAVALPQYQLAVTKSRVTGILPVIQNIRQAEHIYYLEHGNYTPYLKEMDLTITGDANSGGMIHDDWHLNMHFDRFSVSYCPSSGIKNGSQKCLRNILFSFTQYFDNSTPRHCTIHRNQVLSAKLCQILLNS